MLPSTPTTPPSPLFDTYNSNHKKTLLVMTGETMTKTCTGKQMKD
jgi:hypothetical protein